MKFLSLRIRQIMGEMTPKTKEGKEQKWAESKGNNKNAEGRISDEARVSPNKTLSRDVKSELPNDLDRSYNEALDSVLKPLSRLNINVEESAEKNECEVPLKVAQNSESYVNATLNIESREKCTKPESKNGASCEKNISRERTESKVDVFKNSDSIANVKGETDGGKSPSEGELETTKSAKKGLIEGKPATTSETLPTPESVTSEKLASSINRPCRTRSETPASERKGTQARTEPDNNNNSDRKEFVKTMQPPPQPKIHRSGKAEDSIDRDPIRGNESTRTEIENSKGDPKVEELVLNFKMFVSLKKRTAESVKYKSRNPQPGPVPCTVGGAGGNSLHSMEDLATAPGFLNVLSANDVIDFFEALQSTPQPIEVPVPIPYDEGMALSDVTDSDRDDSSSAPDSGLDSPRPGECDTPPAQHSWVNKILKDRFKANALRQGVATPINSPSEGSLGSSISSPMSLRDSPLPQYAPTLSPAGSPPSDHAEPDIAQLNAIMCTRTYEEHPNHRFMRMMCERKIVCQGYSTTGPPDREPVLIGFLKEAAKKRPDFQKIYESARCYLTSHLGLLYDEDNAGYTALYYAARLNECDQIAGFIVECLLEAQEKCSLINDPSKTRYRIEEERYGKNDDNILHCLARWHSTSNSYIPVAHTLFNTCNMLQKLKFVPNKEGKYPCHLCCASDMWEFLGGKLIAQYSDELADKSRTT